MAGRDGEISHTVILPRAVFDRVPFQDRTEPPLERLRRRGARSLSDQELLSLVLQLDVLREGITIDDLLEDLDGLAGLTRLDETLFDRSEWDDGRTAALLAAVELACRLARVQIPEERRLLDSYELVARYLVMRYPSHQEIVGALYLDSRQRLLAERELYRGTLTAARVEPREFLKQALLCGAASFVMFHTHPSGDPAPSSDDLAFTRRLEEAGKAMGILPDDHLIIGTGGRWVSLKSRDAF